MRRSQTLSPPVDQTRDDINRRAGLLAHVYGGPVGPPATIVRKLRQVRKEATVANDSGAGVWLAGLPPFRVWRVRAAHPESSVAASCGTVLLADLRGSTWHNRHLSPTQESRPWHSNCPRCTVRVRAGCSQTDVMNQPCLDLHSLVFSCPLDRPLPARVAAIPWADSEKCHIKYLRVNGGHGSFPNW